MCTDDNHPRNYLKKEIQMFAAHTTAEPNLLTSLFVAIGLTTPKILIGQSYHVDGLYCVSRSASPFLLLEPGEFLDCSSGYFWYVTHATLLPHCFCEMHLLFQLKMVQRDGLLEYRSADFVYDCCFLYLIFGSVSRSVSPFLLLEPGEFLDCSSGYFWYVTHATLLPHCFCEMHLLFQLKMVQRDGLLEYRSADFVYDCCFLYLIFGSVSRSVSPSLLMEPGEFLDCSSGYFWYVTHATLLPHCFCEMHLLFQLKMVQRDGLLEYRSADFVYDCCFFYLTFGSDSRSVSPSLLMEPGEFLGCPSGYWKYGLSSSVSRSVSPSLLIEPGEFLGCPSGY
ncbi:hypothetical protein BDC45DRAFT_540210 [Circinella umbellata]|nr:hypothetical protein BDC45DRAFT_540210 [Circinella umbellata]